jgi:two-component system chemotaxis sensor kinase CheA
MGDGAVALILDVVGLAQQARIVSEVRDRPLGERPSGISAPAGERQSVLLFATGDGGRLAIPLAQVARLEEFARSALERVGPVEVVQYRGEILPLIDVARALRPRVARRGHGASRRPGLRRNVAAGGNVVPVVVYAGGGRRVGLIVERIIDIAEDALVVRAPAQRPGVLFTAVIQGKVTEFLDVEAMIRGVDPDIFADSRAIEVEA